MPAELLDSKAGEVEINYRFGGVDQEPGVLGEGCGCEAGRDGGEE